MLHDGFQRDQHIPIKVLASILGIDHKTLKTRIKELGIETGYSNISGNKLDVLIKEYLLKHSSDRHAYVIGQLHALHSL